MLIVIVLTLNRIWFLELDFLPCPQQDGSDCLYKFRVQIKSYAFVIRSSTPVIGTPTMKIVTKNILPQLVSVIVTQTSQLLPSFISYEAFLSFFGLGLPITVPSLGRLISDYSQNVTTNAYLFWIPLTVLILVSLIILYRPS